MKTLIGILVVALATAGAALAVSPTETVELKAAAGSPVRGTVTAGAAGKGTRVVFKLHGLAANANARAVFHPGTCARPGASFADAGSAVADTKGFASWRGTIRFRGTPVSWKTAADGGHLIAVVSGGKVVACGVIPGMS